MDQELIGASWTMSGTQTQSIKCPHFSGKKGDYPFWMIQFRAYAATVGISDALEDGFQSKLPPTEMAALDETNDAALIKARNRNARAMAALTLGQKDNKVMALIHRSRSKDWPGGLAHEAVKLLKKRFEPDDDMAELDMQAELDKLKLGKNEDPELLQDKVAEIQAKYGVFLDADDMKALVS